MADLFQAIQVRLEKIKKIIDTARMNIFRDILITLGFMTRIGPVMEIEADDIGRTVKWMPLSGLVLGAVIVLPFWLGLFAGKFWIQSWLTVAASVYLTRGLHFDGFADIADGAGPYPDPERFWKIIKDSCSGVFGVLASVLAVLGQAVCFFYVYEAGAYGAAIWIFVLGRLGNALMSMVGKPLARPGQGSLSMRGADGLSIGVGGLTAILVGAVTVSPVVQLLAYVFCGCAILFLFRLAKRVNGVNGDFLGASVVLCELAGLLAFCALN
ncbi:adenosylcobinamide-GDP ribazoletransferase [Maridesulfovibrio sp.]|uniref:adenosylcobinamide-GDP ribazoletransferase n=1 Tax=Maridesulfovibrio sp. TaxID=2795000 RepID=UPI002A18A7C2|nr:adenosylcobinamide-GDP ribazoletransferase [Maridesulfovibrio sp.]